MPPSRAPPPAWAASSSRRWTRSSPSTRSSASCSSTAPPRRCSAGPREEALGACLDDFLPQRFRASHRELVRRFGDSGTTSRRMGGQRIVLGLRRNGEEFPIDASISHAEEQGERYYTVILRDVTERVRAETELRAFAARRFASSRSRRARCARRRSGASRASCTTSWGRRSRRSRWTWGGCASTSAAAPGALADKLAAMQELLDSTRRRHAPHLGRPAPADAGRPRPDAAFEWLVENFRKRTGAALRAGAGADDLDLADPYCHRRVPRAAGIADQRRASRRGDTRGGPARARDGDAWS